jgi:hypothetical protein
MFQSSDFKLHMPQWYEQVQEVLERNNPPTSVMLFSKLYSLQIMTMHNITELYTQLFSDCLNIT